ncbi:MAG: hypothetical protein ACK5UE_03865 [Chitinophagales bacterium]|jgi:hypothetical protein|nr:hypothetical protein [Sphingobacteriales bacterium]
MANGIMRFEAQLEIIEILLKESKAQENRVFWLFDNNLRTHFFMLQGLARLYAKAHNKKLFTKIKNKSKEIEDAFGWLDFYNSYTYSFTRTRSISAEVKTFFKDKFEQSVDNCHKLLKKEGWYNGDRIKKIRKQLKEADWKDENVEAELFASIYKKEATEILQFLRDHEFHFADMEHDVHELRRKLRWLSIYPQALQGAVKLVPNAKDKTTLEKYHTEDIVNSPYNQFKASRKLAAHLKLNKPQFLALSWLIAELGELKDKGQRIEILTYALMKVEGLTKEKATEKTYTLIAKTYPKEEILLNKASSLSQEFVSLAVLDNLVID